MTGIHGKRHRTRPITLTALSGLLCAALAAPAHSTEITAEAMDRIRSARVEAKERIDAGQLAEALGPAKRAYDYAQQDLGPEDRALATTAAALGTLLLDLDRPIDALRPLTHALELYDHQRGRTSLGSRTMQRRIAEANRRLERYETAELAWLDLVKRTHAVEGDTTRDLALIYARLQILLTESGAHVRSRRYGVMSVKLYQQAEGKDSLPVGLVTVKLARTSLELGEWNEAMDFLDLGIPILEKRLEPGDPQLTTLYEFLVGLFEKAGDDGRARRYRVRLKKNLAVEAQSG